MIKTPMDALYYWIPTFAALALMGLIGFVMILFERRDERRRAGSSEPSRPH